MEPCIGYLSREFVADDVKEDISHLSFSPDGDTFLAVQDENLIVWDTQTGKSKKTYLGHQDYIYDIAISPDGQWILTGSKDNKAIRWSQGLWKNEQEFVGHEEAITSVDIAPDGKTILTGSFDDKVILWDAKTGKQIKVFTQMLGSVTAVAFSPNGKEIVAGTGGRCAILLWDKNSGTLKRVYKGHEATVESVHFSRDGNSLISQGYDGRVIIWDKETGEIKRWLYSHIGEISEMAFSPNGDKIVSAHLEREFPYQGIAYGRAVLWDTRAGKELKSFRGHRGSVLSVAYAPDGKHILTGGSDSTALLWKTDTGEGFRLAKLDGPVGVVEISPNNRYILTGAGITKGIHHDSLPGMKERSLILWDRKTGERIRDFPDHKLQVDVAAFSPDGKELLARSRQTKTILWEVETGRKLREFSHYAGSVAFSPDGKYILLGDKFDQAFKLYHKSTGTLLRTYTGHTQPVEQVVFSSDSKTIISSGREGERFLWDLDANEPIQTLSQIIGKGPYVAVSPNKKHLATSHDTEPLIWMPTRSPLQETLNAYLTPLQTLIANLSEDKRKEYGIYQIWDYIFELNDYGVNGEKYGEGR